MTIVVNFSFLTLLFLRLDCVRRVIGVGGRRFSRSIGETLCRTSEGLRLGRALHCLRGSIGRARHGTDGGSSIKAHDNRLSKAVRRSRRCSIMNGSNAICSSFRLGAVTAGPTGGPGTVVLHDSGGSLGRARGSLRRVIGGHCICRGTLLSRIICSVLCSTSSGPLGRQVGFGRLSRSLGTRVVGGKVGVPCRFAMAARSNERICHYPSCASRNRRCDCSRMLFHGSPRSGVKIMGIRFPSVGDCVFSDIHFVVPDIVFALMLLVAFVFAVIIVFQRGQCARVGGSFVGGVARRLGAPVTDVDLTTRVLGSPSISGDRRVRGRLNNIVSSRSGHLHFLMRGMLRVDVFSHGGTIFGGGRLSLGRVIRGTTRSFTLHMRRAKKGVCISVRTVSSALCISRIRFRGIVFGLVSGTIGCHGPRRPLFIAVGA